MANKNHVALLKRGSDIWNEWRREHPEIAPDLSRVNLIRTGKFNLNIFDLRRLNLSGADLRGTKLRSARLDRADLSYANLKGADIMGADLRGANLSGLDLSRRDLRANKLRYANLSKANLSYANLSMVDLSEANLSEANLRGVDLSEANLIHTNLSGANLGKANLSGQDLSNKDLSRANLSAADLTRTILIGTDLTGATLTDCMIYGIAAWNVQLEGAIQKNLIITQKHEAIITIDNLKVAQFIYLMLNNKEIRDVINTLTTKSVLILGRFTSERKGVLDTLRDALRAHNYLPILFDFEKPSSLDLTETIATLAHLSRFVIIDLTDPRSSPHEAATIIPHCKIPIQPIVRDTQEKYSMFSDFKLYPWVLNLYRYRDKDALIASLKEHIIEPAEHKAEELEKLKNSK